MPEDKKYKSGFVNIIGNPNVGKSTLMNKLMDEKLAIATHKAQTTRHRIKGILSGDGFQIVFSDTPGILEPAYELQSRMMDYVKEALIDADLILYMVEPGERKPRNEDVFEKLKKAKFLFPVFILGICFIEFLQFITKRGYAEIDDVILNTMGVAIGFGVYRFLLKFLKFHATLN